MSDSEFADGFLRGASNGLAVGNMGASLDIARNVKQMAQDAIADSNKLHQAIVAANSAEIKAKTAARLLKVANDRIDELEQQFGLQQALDQASRRADAAIAAMPNFGREMAHNSELGERDRKINSLTQQLKITEAQVLEWMAATAAFRKLSKKLAAEDNIPQEKFQEILDECAVESAKENAVIQNTKIVIKAAERIKTRNSAPKES